MELYLIKQISELPTELFLDLKESLNTINIPINDLVYLDSGFNGVAFSFQDDIVVKLTHDLNEKDIAVKLLAKSNCPFAKIHHVFSFEKFSVIVQEKLDTHSFLNSEIFKIAESCVDNIDGIFTQIMLDERVFYLATEHLNKREFSLMEIFIEECKKLNIELYELTGTEKNDFHLYNLGYKKDGSLSAFDHSVLY